MKGKALFAAIAIITITALLGISGTAQAGDTGHYFDPDRSGEGITLFRNNHLDPLADYVHFAFYTFEAEQGCYHVTIPYYKPVNEENCHESRWFVTGAAQLFTDAQGNSTATGALLCPFGIEFPDGIPVLGNPFAVIVGDAYRCADFYLESFQGGWRVAFDRYGEILPEDDPIFGRVYEFTKLVFLGAD